MQYKNTRSNYDTVADNIFLCPLVQLCQLTDEEITSQHTQFSRVETLLYLDTKFIHRKSQSGSLTAVYHYNKTKTHDIMLIKAG